MKLTLWNQIQLFVRRLIPFVITLLLLVFTVAPIYFSGYQIFLTMLPLMSIFHWSVYKPELLPGYSVLFLGLAQDILQGIPIGVNAIVFLLVYGVVTSQHRFFFRKSFSVVWMGFGIVLGGAGILMWLLISMLNNVVIEPLAVSFDYLLSLGLYPLLARGFLRAQKFILDVP